MDILSRELSTLRIRSTIHCPTEVRMPFSVSFDRKGGSPFYIVTEGECWLSMGTLDPRDSQAEVTHLRAGELAILPRDQMHCLHDNLGTPAVSLSALLENHTCDADGIWRFDAHEGKAGPKTVMVGGIFNFDNALTSPLMHSLPPLIHVRPEWGGETSTPWLTTILDLIAAEMRNGFPGSESVIARLSDVLFVQALRACVGVGDGKMGWLQALSDESLRPVLSLIHTDPSRPWTVAELASHAAMSRSGFAARFTELIGEPPLRYVTRLRMHRAAELLTAGSKNTTVANIADEVGYETEASFSKAFKQWLGTSPAAFRRNAVPPAPQTSGFVPLPHLMRLAQQSAAY